MHRRRMMTDTRLPDRVRLPLLDLVTASSLDEDYEHAAARRAESPEQPRTRAHRVAAVVVGVFGLLIVTAAVQTSRNEEVAEAGRAELIAQVQDRSEELRDLQSGLQELREENAGLARQLQQLVEADRAVSARLLDLAAVSGYASVTGPGIRIRLDDSPDGSTDGIVRDQDLAILLDGLWAAGAEAIAVNGERVTSLGGIQNVGRSVHLGTVPLSPPYSVLAIGDPNTLQARFVESPQGGSWFALRNAFGFEFDMSNAGQMTLPGEPVPQLRSAEPLEDESAAKMEGSE